MNNPGRFWYREPLRQFGTDPISLRIGPARRVAVAKGNLICEIDQAYEWPHHHPPHAIYDWHPYRAVLQHKPCTGRNHGPFMELPKAFRQQKDRMLRGPGGNREMVDILALVLHHDDEAARTATELALAERLPTKWHVLGLVQSLPEGKTTGAQRSKPRSDWP